MRIIFHIDVNSAYLSWEAAYRLQKGDSLDIRTIPAVIGGSEDHRHGIVLAKSALAKKQGVLTGEPLIQARGKCKDLKVFPPNYKLYRRASQAFNDFLKQYTASVESFSIDESFCDFSYYQGDPIKLAEEIKERIANELGFSVKIGIGNNKLLAKMATKTVKDEEINHIFSYEVEKKMWPLPIGQLFSVGSATKKKMRSRGIETIGDLARTDSELIRMWLKKPGERLWQYAWGKEDSLMKKVKEEQKSIGNSSTFSFDLTKEDEIKKAFLGISECLGMRMRKEGVKGKTLHIAYRNNELVSAHFQHTLPFFTDRTSEIFNFSYALYQVRKSDKPIRSLGISFSDLMEEPYYEIHILRKKNESGTNLDRTLDRIRERYGNDSVMRACFLQSAFSPVIGGVLQDKDYTMMSSQL